LKVIQTLKVIEIGTNRKPIFDFLLVVDSNLSCISDGSRNCDENVENVEKNCT